MPSGRRVWRDLKGVSTVFSMTNCVTSERGVGDWDIRWDLLVGQRSPA